MIILVGGEKGGTGKTTIATNLAAMRASRRDVLLVDTDTQGSASMWAQTRQEEGVKPSLTCVSARGKGVAAEITKLAPRFEDVIIDSGGRDSVELRQAMLVAQVMIIPARPSQFDLHGLAATNQIVEDARGFNPGLVALVVINSATTHSTNTDAREMASAIADMPNLRVARAILRDRVSFRRASRDGMAVTEYSPPDEKAIAEIRLLYKETFA
jgi:chromosome partitioning protein